MQMHDRLVHLRPGALFWMRPGGLYLGDHDKRNRLGVNYIHFDLLKRGRVVTGRVDIHREHRDVLDVEYVETITRRIARAWQSAKVGHTDQADVATQLLRGLLMDMDANESKQANAHQPRGGTERHHYQLAMRAAARLSEDLTNAPSIAEIAQQASCTPDHLTRVFSKVMGMSPQAYLVQRRIDRAKQLLRETGLTVSQIADVLGYRDVYFFSRQFKQKSGWTPTEYRRGE